MSTEVPHVHPSNAPLSPSRFVTVAIGASAGGVEALQHLFRLFSHDTGMAFVVVLHMSPEQTSLLDQILAKATAMPVRFIADGDVLEANVVHILPPGRYAVVHQGVFRLTPRPSEAGSSRPIDAVFESLSQDQGPFSVGVVLSGSGTDGTAGLGEIMANGGLALAQDPAEAGNGQMPTSAIDAGATDHVGRLEDLVQHIREWSQQQRQLGPLADQVVTLLPELLGVLSARSGRDYRGYKHGTLSRRIQRRMGLRDIENPRAYLEFLRRDQDEPELLAQEMLVGVTRFFRDPEAWAQLDEELVRTLNQKIIGYKFRAWVAGCSSGQEAYSLAMVLADVIEREKLEVSFQLFASDIDQAACQRARQGMYPEEILSEILERYRRFFVQRPEGWQIVNTVRERITFASPHNLLSDPPFSNMDLISCRNVLIYFGTEAQKQVLSLCHYALRENGLLFLGTSEFSPQHSHLYQTIDAKTRLYRRRSVPTVPIAKAMPLKGWSRLSGAASAVAGSTADRPAESAGDQTLRIAREALAPAFVLLTENYQVLYFSGNIKQFVGPPIGRPTNDLLAMFGENLRAKVRGALHEAKARHTVLMRHVDFNRGESAPLVELDIRTLTDPSGTVLLAMAFRDEPLAKASAGAHPTTVKDETIVRLERELESSKELLSASIHDLESSNESLKASNEEILSMNEELQSGNEELETSKEELQSLNEELSTVNDQLSAKVGELKLTSDYLTNLFSSINIPTIFLDRQLLIRRFTPAAHRLLRLKPVDIGRPVTDLADMVTGGVLVSDAQKVLSELVPSESEVHAQGGEWFLLRCRPYRTEEDRIEGVVVTLVDITKLKQAEEALGASEATYRGTFENAAVGIAHLSANGHFLHANQTLCDILGYNCDELQAMDTRSLITASEGNDFWSRLEEVVSRRRSRDSFELPLRCKDGAKRWLRFTISGASNHSQPYAIVIVEDVTERYQATASLRQEKERFRRVCENRIVGIAFIESDGRISYANAAFTMLFRYTTDDIASGQIRISQLVSAGQLEQIEGKIRNQSQVFEPTEVEIQTKDGRTACCLVAGTRLEASDERALFLLDISARREMETRLEHQAEELRRSNNDLSQFASMASHDLQAPLRRIGSFVSLAVRQTKGKLEDAPRRHLETAVENIAQMRQMILDLMAYARCELGESASEPSSLRVVLDAAMDILGLTQEQRAEAIVVEGELPVVNAPARLLVQILQNLIENALKYCGDQRPRIVIVAEPGPHGWTVSVTDNGSGIDPEIGQRVFDLFSRGQTALPGSGLGLAICRKAVSRFGGKIWFEPVQPRGTRFAFTIPATPHVGDQP